MIYWVTQYAVPPDAPGGTRHFELAKHLCRAGEPVTVLAGDLNLSRLDPISGDLRGRTALSSQRRWKVSGSNGSTPRPTPVTT
jgi:hypothetical protein